MRLVPAQGLLPLSFFLGTERRRRLHFPSVGLGSTPCPTTPFRFVPRHTVGLGHLSAAAFSVSVSLPVTLTWKSAMTILRHGQIARLAATRDQR